MGMCAETILIFTLWAVLGLHESCKSASIWTLGPQIQGKRLFCVILDYGLLLKLHFLAIDQVKYCFNTSFCLKPLWILRDYEQFCNQMNFTENIAFGFQLEE